MSTIQETFDAVIDAGIYGRSFQFMCNALDVAVNTDVILPEEAASALSAIQGYLDALGYSKHGSLAGALKHAGIIPPCYSHAAYVCLPIYRDWDNRPMPKGKQ